MTRYPGIKTSSIDLMTRSNKPVDYSEQRKRLGEFIRLHRQRVKPEAKGFAATARRRTPGLRREELAQLCAVSATWITWLEQGRGVAASAGVLARVAETLQLSPAERAYLFELAKRRDPSEPHPPRAVVPHAVLRSVHAIDCPAYVLDRRWDVVAANTKATDLFLDFGGKMGHNPPNLLRFLFLFGDARPLIHEWHMRAWRLVAEFRADCGRLADAPPIRELVEELTNASSDFARLWHTHDVLEREGGLRRFHHPKRGDLLFEQLTLHPAVRSDLKLVMLLRATGGNE